MTHLVRIYHHNGAVRILRLDENRGTKVDHVSVRELAIQLDGSKYHYHVITPI